VRASRRMPEAQADIAAARAAPTGLEIAMQEIDRAAEQGVRELRDAPTSFRAGAEGPIVRGSISAALLPGGNVTLDTTHTIGGLVRSLDGRPHIEIERADVDCAIAALQAISDEPTAPPSGFPSWHPVPPDAVILTGPEAARYCALQDAARAAHEATKAVVATNTALRDAFHAFCSSIYPDADPKQP